jgi:hypothetical protein
MGVGGCMTEVAAFWKGEIRKISKEHCAKCELKEYYVYSSESKCRSCEHGKNILIYLKGLHEYGYFDVWSDDE